MAGIAEIRGAAERVAGSLGLDVVDVEFTGTAKSRTLCVYLEKTAERRKAEADKVMAGAADAEAIPERYATGELNLDHLSWLTHEDCADFSRDFGTLLDVEDLVPEGNYTLEASSPGLNRKLTRQEDFERFKGCQVKVQTFTPINNNRHWRGRLTAVTGSGGEPSTEPTVELDLSVVKQNSKSRKAGVSKVAIAISNIERAELVPDF